MEWLFVDVLKGSWGRNTALHPPLGATAAESDFS